MTSSLGSGFDASHIKEVLSDSLTGIGIAFVPTITGVFFRIILSWEHYMIAHEVEYALKDFKRGENYTRAVETRAVAT
jgi:hypothetical protein